MPKSLAGLSANFFFRFTVLFHTYATAQFFLSWKILKNFQSRISFTVSFYFVFLYVERLALKLLLKGSGALQHLIYLLHSSALKTTQNQAERKGNPQRWFSIPFKYTGYDISSKTYFFLIFLQFHFISGLLADIFAILFYKRHEGRANWKWDNFK